VLIRVCPACSPDTTLGSKQLTLFLVQHTFPGLHASITKSNPLDRRWFRRLSVLFPLRFVDFNTLPSWKCSDADTGKDSAREIRECYIADFSNWKAHDDYRREFEKLLSDLNAAPEQDKVLDIDQNHDGPDIE
jgi:hypothetical protein